MGLLTTIFTVLFGLGAIAETDKDNAKRYTVCFIVCLVLTVAVWAIDLLA